MSNAVTPDALDQVWADLPDALCDNIDNVSELTAKGEPLKYTYRLPNFKLPACMLDALSAEKTYSMLAEAKLYGALTQIW